MKSLNRLSRRLPVAALVLSLGIPAILPAGAFAGPSHSERNVFGDLVEVQVLVEGQASPLYYAPGRFDRHYFQALRGRNYSLAVRNTTGERVGVLIAVDGLNVVDGERSTLSNSEAMYILDPHERAEIRGWRTSLDDIRKFVFVDEERSYAERSGKANGDMGWIRVLSFREAGAPWISNRGRRMRDSRHDENSAEEPYAAGEDGYAPPSAAPTTGDSDSQLRTERRSLEGKESNPGTGWGDHSRDRVNRTHFTAGRRASDHMIFRYEYAPGLLALGIDVRRQRDRLSERERGDFGFAQPPRRR